MHIQHTHSHNSTCEMWMTVLVQCDFLSNVILMFHAESYAW